MRWELNKTRARRTASRVQARRAIIRVALSASSTRIGRRLALSLLCLLLGQAIIVPPAFSEEVTRSVYVEKSEPICKLNTIDTRRVLRGIRDDVRKGELRRAGHKFGRAATSLKKTIKRLEALPQPATDESRLTRWFAGLTTEAHLLEKLARQLDKGHTKGLARTILELRHQANVTNNIVLTFGFEFCLLQPARYL